MSVPEYEVSLIKQTTIHVTLALNRWLAIVSSFPHDCLFSISTERYFICIYCLLFLILADHPDSCKYLNVSSSLASSFIKSCNTDNTDDEYECRKVVISYRSVETYLRRDCAPKGLCSWKDKTGSMISTPVSDCVYTDERSQKLECIYCCDTPLCNGARFYPITMRFLIYLLGMGYLI